MTSGRTAFRRPAGDGGFPLEGTAPLAPTAPSERVTVDVGERFHFNTAISAVMELVNELYLLDGVPAETPLCRAAPQREADREHPEASWPPSPPTSAEELWERMGHGESIFSVPWPDFDGSLLVEEEWQIVVQVNGRVRGKVTLPAGSGEEEVRQAATGKSPDPGMAGEGEGEQGRLRAGQTCEHRCTIGQLS